MANEESVRSDFEPQHGFRSNPRLRDRDEVEYDGHSEARIGSQIDHMQSSLLKLTGLVDGLQTLLEPILLPLAEVSERAVPSPPRKPASEMSNTIDDLNGQISHLQRMVSILTGRVQL